MQWASSAFASSSESEYRVAGSRLREDSAVGPADVHDLIDQCGAYYDTWAPDNANTGDEWLVVGFDVPVYATHIEVFEINNAPFVTSIEISSASAADGSTRGAVLFAGPDTTNCSSRGSRVLHVRLDGSVLVSHLRINTFSAPAANVCREMIDAVRLHGLAEDAPNTAYPTEVVIVCASLVLLVVLVLVRKFLQKPPPQPHISKVTPATDAHRQSGSTQARRPQRTQSDMESWT